MILKITLVGSDPKIWRRVAVDSGLSLDDLNYVIQCVFNWDNAHLYQFLVTPGGKITRKAMREATRFTMMGPGPAFDDDDSLPADEAMTGRVFTPDCKQILYEYDFGDSWEHLVKLEKRSPGAGPDFMPVCLGGENEAPFEDMGGIYSYYRWIDALRDPDDEMHEEAEIWLGEGFDPAVFDLSVANERLTAAFRPPPKRPRKKRSLSNPRATEDS